MLLRVNDAEHQFQVPRDVRSTASLHFLDHASAAQGGRGRREQLIPHALVHLLRPEHCLAVAEGDAHARRRAVAGCQASSDRNRRALYPLVGHTRPNMRVD
jgi:hypothetical protein